MYRSQISKSYNKPKYSSYEETPLQTIRMDYYKLITFNIPIDDTTFFDNIYFRSEVNYTKMFGESDPYNTYKYIYTKNNNINADNFNITKMKNMEVIYLDFGKIKVNTINDKREMRTANNPTINTTDGLKVYFKEFELRKINCRSNKINTRYTTKFDLKTNCDNIQDPIAMYINQDPSIDEVHKITEDTQIKPNYLKKLTNDVIQTPFIYDNTPIDSPIKLMGPFFINAFNKTDTNFSISLTKVRILDRRR